jgi:hypothetical protein
MVDKNDFITKRYAGKDKVRIQKWYMHYCDACKIKRSYAPKNKTGLCISCACKHRVISDEQRKNISRSLLGNKNASNITPQKIIERTAKRMGLSVDMYIAEKQATATIRKMKKNMLDRLNRFVRDERKSVKYFSFSRKELIQHFESKFYNHPDTNESMTWLNYGRISGINCWEIDHKIPLRYKEKGMFYWDQEELKDHSSLTFKKAWSLENLQPMWAKLNWSKGAKYKG